MDALAAYRSGDERPLWAFFQGWAGQQPDALAKTAIKGHMPESRGDLRVRPYLYELKYEYGARLNEKRQRKQKPTWQSGISRGIKKNPSLDVSLKRVASSNEGYTRQLTYEIPGRAYILQGSGTAAEDLAGKVAEQIRREAAERADKS